MGFFSDLDETPETVEAPKSKGFFSDLEKEPSRTRSLLSAFPKGLVKGVQGLNNLRDPIGTMLGGGKLDTAIAERVLPTQKGKFAEEALETAGELAPSIATGPGRLGAKAVQLGVGALSKSALKEAGAPEILQDVGSAALSSIPQGIRGALSKAISPSKAQKPIYDMLKNSGMTDKQIVPFIQSKKKVNALAKWTKSFINKEKVAAAGKPVSENIYRTIEQKGETLPPLTGPKRIAFNKSFNNQLEDIPYFFRDMIKKDVDRLKSSPLNWKNLREFEMAVSNKVKDAEGGKAVLNSMKDPINLAERMLSPELFKEKQIMNQAYSQHKNLLKKLTSGDIEKFLNKGEIWATGLYLLSGNWLLKGLAIKKGTEFALSKFLTSPRFQGMGRKLLSAMKKNNSGAVVNLTTKMMEDLNKFVKEESNDYSEQNVREQIQQ